MDKDSVLRPIQVRFTEPADVEAYGDGWHTYDELQMITLPARVLIPLENEIGVPLPEVMTGVRVSSVFGDTAAAWLALRFEGHAVPFAEFNPVITLATWRRKPAEAEAPGKDEEPTPESADPPAPAPSPIQVNSSDPLDIVSLPIMPATGSSSS